MTKSYFVISCLIFIGIYVKDAYLEESKLLKNGARGALTALSDQLKNQALTISEMQITQTQISNVMTSMMTTLTKLDLKIDTEFAKMDTKFGKLETDHIQLNKKIKALDQETANSLSGLVNRVETLETEVKELNNRQEKGRNETLYLISNFTLEWKEQIGEAQSNCSTRKPLVGCKSLMKNGCSQKGVYIIRPNASENSTLQAFCDLEDDGGGWTVIQRRGVREIPKAQRENFNRSWTEYERGFGSVDDDHWIGLKHIHTLSKDCENELKVTLAAWNGTQFYAKYSNFQISGKEDDYHLTIGNFTAGTLGNSHNRHMDYNNGMKFTTFDKDNDKWRGRNCAISNPGAWWHNFCSNVFLNGEYADDGTNGRVEGILTGIYWHPDHNYSFKKSEMKIRTKC